MNSRTVLAALLPALALLSCSGPDADPARLTLELEPAGSIVVTVTGDVDISTVWLQLHDAQGHEMSPGRPAEGEARWTFTPLAAGTYSVLVSDGERRAQEAVSVRVEEATEVELALE